MQLPAILKGESMKRLLQGVVVGAVATMVVGFGWGGWVFGGTAASQAAEGAQNAVTAALAPVCAQNFQNADDATNNLAALKDTSSYQRAGFVEKGGWATFPGNEKPANGVARACATILADL